MASYLLGNVVTLSTSTKVGGFLTDPTTITLQVRTPDAATTSYTPTHDTVGAYHYDYTPTMAGRHLYRWVSTGAAAAAAEGEFEVAAAWAAPGLVSVADLKQTINEPAAATADDAELQTVIDGITAVIENRRTILPRVFTEYHNGGRTEIRLDHAPVITVSSITEYTGSTGTALAPWNIAAPTSYDYFLNAEAGILTRLASGYNCTFTSGNRNIVVTYTAGYVSVPPAIRLAALEIARVYFQGTQLGGPGPTADDAIGGQYILGFLVPRKAAEWLAPYPQDTAVA